ncbi:MAG: hypothetical protein NC131_16380 [Roseburia sp.]|nr:hypothetical protein [Bacillota bacterium]MCM1394011.1 hypothetical protein [[Eubacterium] siraeum]MCM1440756.1 hypothetical protein [Roseburia sp.]
MNDKKITTDEIANALIDMNENLGICDSDTAIGLKTSKKRDILKSGKEGSFSKFQQVIIKQQKRKN